MQVFYWMTLVFVGIWALTGMGYFWPVWPILGWGVPLFAVERACTQAHTRKAGALRPEA